MLRVWTEQLRVISLGIKSGDGYFLDAPPGLGEAEEVWSCVDDEEDFSGMDPLEDSLDEADDS